MTGIISMKQMVVLGVLTIRMANADTITFEGVRGGVVTFGTAAAPAPVVVQNGIIQHVSRSRANEPGLLLLGLDGDCGGSACLNFSSGAFLSQQTIGSTTTYTYGAGSLTITGVIEGWDDETELYSTILDFASPITVSVYSTAEYATIAGLLGGGRLGGVQTHLFGVHPQVPGPSYFYIYFDSNGSLLNTIQIQALGIGNIPEPGTYMLMSSAFLALGIWQRKRGLKG
jgi:hypothetical protein